MKSITVLSLAHVAAVGAQLGTRLLWTVLLTWPLMAAVQMMCGRIGMVTGQGLAGSFKQRFPRWLLGVFSAPLVWKGFSWLGNNLGVPKVALELGFVLWWTVPALVAVAAVLHQRALSAGAKGI